jgi:hypothetical protein
MVHPIKSTAMTNNKLTDRLVFKSLLIPKWFGIEGEGVVLLMGAMCEFLEKTLVPEVVQKLLLEENDPDYWIKAETWPYPEIPYYKRICTLIDTNVPEDWPLEIRTFWFAWMMQQIRWQTMNLLHPVYKHNTQKQ